MKYIGYYCSPIEGENRIHVPAATNKMDYIVQTLNRLGISVDLVSASYTLNNEHQPGRVIPRPNGDRVILLPSGAWGGRSRRVLTRTVFTLRLFIWLLRHTQVGETVIVYHSLGYARTIALAKLLRRLRLILEVEEIYADVTGRPADRRKEVALFRHADAFILPTELLNGQVNRDARPHAVVLGTYEVEAERERQWRDERIHVVYAGTFDPRKGEAFATAAAAELLDARYHVHIIGFGSERDTRSLLALIDDVSPKSQCRLTYDGLLTGEDYIRFLQSCDIGLSAQKADAAFNESSFPSKVLSYMANGLRVVTVRLRVLEGSGIGDLVDYSETSEPCALADAIKSVDLDLPYDSRHRIRELDAEFRAALRELVGH